MSEVQDFATDYGADFHAWASEQAALLRSGRLADLDVAHLAEEVEDLGKSVRRELESRLEVLLVHLLKWSYQSGLRGRSWELTIIDQRRRLAKLLRENPSLRAVRHEAMFEAYELALIGAERETSLPRDCFPGGCIWTFEQVLDDDFWPDAG